MRESGDENVRVPPTIQALLAARLDQLDDHEREVLEGGSIEGRLFHRGAVEALYPEEHAGRHEAHRARTQGPGPTRQGGAARRGRVPFSPSADPRRRLRRAAQVHPRGPARALRAAGSRSSARTCRRSTRSWAITSSRRSDTDRSWVSPSTHASASSGRDHLAAAGRRATQRGDMHAGANLLQRADELPLAPDFALQSDEIMAIYFASPGPRAREIAQLHLERASEARRSGGRAVRSDGNRAREHLP